jgi:hypothetical protein
MVEQAIVRSGCCDFSLPSFDNNERQRPDEKDGSVEANHIETMAKVLQRQNLDPVPCAIVLQY